MSTQAPHTHKIKYLIDKVLRSLRLLRGQREEAANLFEESKREQRLRQRREKVLQ